MLCERWRQALRCRFAGGGSKPPRAAPVKSRGGERRGKGAAGSRQVRIVKARPNPCGSVEMLKVMSEPGECMRSWEEPGGYLSAAPAASGVKRARARSRLLRGTGEPVALGSPCRRARGGGSSSSGRNRERQSTGPGHGGGPSRSSGEAPVTGAERRGRAICGSVASQPGSGRNE